MDGRHGNCLGNSSGQPPRNVLKKCYSLPILQKENEKLKHDLKVLQAAHDEKEILLAESLLKVDLLDEQNNELKILLKAAVGANKEKVEMKDASTCVITETKKTSVVTVDSEIQVKMEDSTHSVTIEGENGSTSSSVSDVYNEINSDDEAKCKTSVFDEMIRELSHDEKTEIIIFDEKLKDSKLSSNMVKHFETIGGANTSKVVNNILNAIATKNLLKQFVWDANASNSFQSLENVLFCIHSAVCSNGTTQQDVNNIIKNALKNARAKW